MDNQEIVQTCRELVLALAQHADHREAQEAAALWAEQGTFNRGGRAYTGPAEILAVYEDEPPGRLVRHVNGGTIVSVIDPDHANAVTYYIAYRYDDPDGKPVELPAPLAEPFSVGEWHDQFVRTPEGWRFAWRESKPAFASHS